MLPGDAPTSPLPLTLRIAQLRPSDIAWLAVPVIVLVWDAKCPKGEMLSQASRRYRDARPVLWGATLLYVAGHLYHVWPEEYDPLSRLAAAFGR